MAKAEPLRPAKSAPRANLKIRFAGKLVRVDNLMTALLEARTAEEAQVGPPAWVDERSFYASSNVGRDFAFLDEVLAP